MHLLLVEFKLFAAQTHLMQMYSECKPPPRPTSDLRFNPDFRTNLDLDPDVCRITPKMLWIHYLVSVSHFAECRENEQVTVLEMLINLLKSPILQ